MVYSATWGTWKLSSGGKNPAGLKNSHCIQVAHNKLLSRKNRSQRARWPRCLPTWSCEKRVGWWPSICMNGSRMKPISAMCLATPWWKTRFVYFTLHSNGSSPLGWWSSGILWIFFGRVENPVLLLSWLEALSYSLEAIAGKKRDSWSFRPAMITCGYHTRG